MKLKKEVSCLALTFYYEYLFSKNIPKQLIQNELPYSPEYLDNRLNWIDFQTFCLIEKRMEEIFKEVPDIHYRIGKSLSSSSGFGFVRVLIRAFFSSLNIYKRIPKVVKHFLFPFITISIVKHDNFTYHARYEFDDGYNISDAFLETVRGMLCSVPEILGAPVAKVTCKRTSKNVALFHIHISRRKRGPFLSFKFFLKRFFSSFLLWKKTISETAMELEETNRLLNEKVDSLTETKEVLDVKIRHLTIINDLYSASDRDLDLDSFLQSACNIISFHMSDCAVAILLSPSSISRWDFLGYHNLTEEMKNELENNIKIIEYFNIERRNDIFRITISSNVFTAIALKDINEYSSLLLIDSTTEQNDHSFLETLKNIIESTIEKSLSAKTIEDLTNHLDLRVKERTAELELTKDKLEHAIEHLEKANRVKSEFLTNISHEFKTPLTLIFAPLDELEKILIEFGCHNYLEKIHLIRRNSQTLLNYVNELMDFLRIDTDRIPIEPENIDLVVLLENVIEILEPLYLRKFISIKLHKSGPAAEIFADYRLMTRVFSNILVNAIKYTYSQDRINIYIAMEPSRATVSIEDHGPGIAAEYLKQIFERFQRVTSSDGRTIEGSGIGLAMVKEIVEMHHGCVKVESEINKKTVFTVSLPTNILVQKRESSKALARDMNTSDEMRIFTANTSELYDKDIKLNIHTPIANLSQRPKILLVEDNYEMQNYLYQFLSSYFQISVASNGREGLNTALEQLPELIIADVMMPEMDGYVMTTQIKKHPKTRNIPILLLTACNGIENVVKGFDCGIEDFIMKPFSSRELLARINVQLKLKSLTHSLINSEKRAAIGTLASGIAHEVLNPVNAILNATAPITEYFNSDRVQSSDTVRELKNLLNIIIVSGKKINETVSAILTIARQSHKEKELEYMVLGDAIDSILKVLSYRINDRIVIHKDYLFCYPVLCLPALLNQAFMNIIVNAVDALEDKGQNIWISTRSDERNVYVSIKDDGPGVPVEQKEFIFNPFYTTKPAGSGTGLGLAITKEIMFLHNGSIKCISNVGFGCEFVISIPFVDKTILEKEVQNV